jgi:hypothetical protein
MQLVMAWLVKTGSLELGTLLPYPLEDGLTQRASQLLQKPVKVVPVVDLLRKLAMLPRLDVLM